MSFPFWPKFKYIVEYFLSLSAFKHCVDHFSHALFYFFCIWEWLLVLTQNPLLYTTGGPIIGLYNILLTCMTFESIDTSCLISSTESIPFSQLQLFSIGLAHFLKQKLHSQNNMDTPPNHLAIVYNRIEFLIHFIKLQMSWYIFAND